MISWEYILKRQIVLEYETMINLNFAEFNSFEASQLFLQNETPEANALSVGVSVLPPERASAWDQGHIYLHCQSRRKVRDFSSAAWLL